MHVAMSAGEKAFFESFLRCSRRYLEFGSGGSTHLAASTVTDWVISIDSSLEWQERVRAECEANQTAVRPTLVHVNIGAVGDWGYPTDEASRDTWPDYHSSVWTHSDASYADFYLVDGRFRVACFMQVILHGKPNALIAIHDFACRPHYFVVRDVAQEIATFENMTIFMRKPDYDPRRAVAILNEHALNPV